MQRWIDRVADGDPLGVEEAERAFHRVVEGDASDVEVAAFLAALKARGEAPSEVAGGVRALRRAMIEVQLEDDGIVDTCGTGGGSLTTFNISTVSALAAAGGGVRVAKHGNRSYTSKCGSADVLETLGVEIELGPDDLRRLFDRVGFVFMYAPRYHPAMGRVAPVRDELGVSTVMNILGPLTSPARVRRQVVGVSRPELIDLVAGALEALGHRRALVVHGEPGMDELSPLGPTRGVRLEDGTTAPFEVRPEDFGWQDVDPEGLAGGTPGENARIARSVLQGRRGGAARAAVELNAAAAFWVAGLADDLEEGIERARQSLDEGAGWRVLERLGEESRRLAAGGPDAGDAGPGEGDGREVSTSG